jgi:hypothetical protein
MQDQSASKLTAAAGSTLLLAVNAGLLRHVFRFDRDAHGE